MKILLEYSSAEILIKNSKFLAEIFPIKMQNEARELLKKQKQTHCNASHIVHAFVLGQSCEVLGCSDGGEPSGTAGKPVLTVLKNSGITDIMLTVTRWFGGTLLGTGGLVKAYTDSAKYVLAKAAAEEFILKLKFTLISSYPKYEMIKKYFEEFDLEICVTEFAEKVKVEGLIPAYLCEPFTAFLENAVKGSQDIVLTIENGLKKLREV